MEMPPIPIPVLVIISLIFLVILLVLAVYLIWLQGDIKKGILDKETNWFPVTNSQLRIVNENSGSKAFIDLYLKGSTCTQELLPSDKLWKKYIRKQDSLLVATPIETSLQVCLNDSEVVAIKEDSKKYHRLQKPAQFNPAIRPPNPLTVSKLERETSVSKWLVIVSVPAGICWCFLLFSLLLF